MKSHFIDNVRTESDTLLMTSDNKSIVQQALAALITTGDVAALGRFLRDDFVHHRPESNRNKEQWLAAVRAVPIADLRVEVQHVLADGPYVVMSSRRRLASGGLGILGVDVWRIEDGLIVEGWETIEPVAGASSHMSWWKNG